MPSTLFRLAFFDDERRFPEIELLLDGQGELACHQKAFQPTFLTPKVRYPEIS